MHTVQHLKDRSDRALASKGYVLSQAANYLPVVVVVVVVAVIVAAVGSIHHGGLRLTLRMLQHCVSIMH